MVTRKYSIVAHLDLYGVRNMKLSDPLAFKDACKEAWLTIRCWWSYMPLGPGLHASGARVASHGSGFHASSNAAPAQASAFQGHRSCRDWWSGTLTAELALDTESVCLKCRSGAKAFKLPLPAPLASPQGTLGTNIPL